MPYAAGGGTDLVARMVAQKLNEKWGQPVIVENRAGAGGNLGAEAVFTAAPDGYTLLFTAQGPLVVNKSLYGKLNYDPDAFTPVSQVVIAYSALLANPNVPAESLQQLIAYAKANPGKLNYASQGIATAAHLIAELFNSMAGVQDQSCAVSRRRAGAQRSGRRPRRHYVRRVGGRDATRAFRPVACAGREQRQAARHLPDVPTVAETLPGFVVTSWWAMVAPPATPPAIAEKISAAVAEALKAPEVAAKLTDMTMVPTGSSPAQLAKFIKDEAERWGAVVRTSGATAQ